MLHTLFHKNKHNRNIEAHEIDQKLAEQIEKLTEANIKCNSFYPKETYFGQLVPEVGEYQCSIYLPGIVF